MSYVISYFCIKVSHDKMYVLKASGEKEEFKPQKLIKSLVKAGASRELAIQVAKEVEQQI